jgi:hypothetical protein
MKTVDQLVEAGKTLGFDVRTEVEASESAWIDVVWFDSRLPLAATGKPKPKLRYSPIIPVVGFEVEYKTCANAKHIKGSVSNLNNLGANLGVIIIGSDNVTPLKRQVQHADKTTEDLEVVLKRRVSHWVHSEARPLGRIAVMLESEVAPWLDRLVQGRARSA